MNIIQRRLVGKGIFDTFGGFPKDLIIGNKYELRWDFEAGQYFIVVDGKPKYKALGFVWDQNLDNNEQE